MFKSKNVSIAVSITIKTILLIIGIVGVALTLSADTFMGSVKGFLYFTIQSNVTILIMAAIFLIADIIRLCTGKEIINKILLSLKFIFTIAILVTFLIFTTVLAPSLMKEHLQYLLSYENLSVHMLVPLIAFADFLIFDYTINLSGAKPLWGVAMPIYYLIFALIGSVSGFDFNGANVPYFFLDYTELGWFSEKGKMGVFYWIAIFTILIIGLSYLIAFLAKLVNRRVGKRGLLNQPKEQLEDID